MSALIAVIAPLTQACFNPARDFGPRLFASLAGWGSIALPGPRGTGFLTVYILAPVIGATIGGGLYTLLLRPCMPTRFPLSIRGSGSEIPSPLRAGVRGEIEEIEPTPINVEIEP